MTGQHSSNQTFEDKVRNAPGRDQNNNYFSHRCPRKLSDAERRASITAWERARRIFVRACVLGMALFGGAALPMPTNLARVAEWFGAIIALWTVGDLVLCYADYRIAVHRCELKEAETDGRRS